MVEYLQGIEEFKDKDAHRTQVFRATHDGEGNRLLRMHRSFISFSFGGKLIEDWNLIAVVEGDRMQRAGYGQFEDLTSTYTVLDGQYYWGTHMLNNQMNFWLATDEITERELQDFLKWFAPGKTRELILMEHPNRAIMARVAAPPTISVIPFEKKIEQKFKQLNSGDTFFNRKTSTTKYSGNISLSLIMDEPYWHAKKHILDEDGVDDWKDVNGLPALVLNDPDAIKVTLEDGVPFSNLLRTTKCFFGGEKTRGSHSTENSAIVDKPILGVADTPWEAVGYMTIGPVYNYGLEDITNISISPSGAAYLYYPGTAPGFPTISFTVPISALKEENTITIASKDGIERVFKFSKPGAIVAQEQANEILGTSGPGSLEKYNRIRDEILHKNIRLAAINILNSGSSGSVDYCGNSASFTFNSKTGEATVLYSGSGQEEKAGDCVLSEYLRIEGQDYLNEDGLITNNECHTITHNINGTLTNFSIKYDIMYL